MPSDKPIGPRIENLEDIPEIETKAPKRFYPRHLRFNPRNLGAFKRLPNGTLIQYVRTTDMPRVPQADTPD